MSRDQSGNTLWHGRFASGPSDELMAYTVSLPFEAGDNRRIAVKIVDDRGIELLEASSAADEELAEIDTARCCRK